MTKFQLLAAAAVAAIAAACASNGANTESASSTSEAPAAAPTTPAQNATYTDAQLRAYTAARTEMEPLQEQLATQTPEQQAQTRTQIAAILERHGLTAPQFNGIANRANQDRAFASRLAGLQPDTFSDETLRAFAAASLEIDPISRALTGQTPEQQAQATEQIRQILQRNNIDSATYNAIAARAQTDPTLAARIASLHRAEEAG